VYTEFSVTINKLKGDVDVRVEGRIQAYVNAETECAYFGLERGGIEQHLHFQGVIVTKEPCHSVSVNATIRKPLG
jgi:hypothetical protein